MQKFLYEILVRESHVDLLGHMNNATYLALYEEARWQIITAGGYGVGVIQSSRQGPVVLEVNLKFLREIRLREKIRIHTEILAYEGKVGKMRQWMEKEDGQTASEAIFSFGLFDLHQRRLIDPTPAWKAAIGL